MDEANLKGKKIKEARIQAGITQVELAKRLCVSPVIISNWENGKRNPKTETLIKIANALNINFRQLIGYAFDGEDFQRFKENSINPMEDIESEKIFKNVFLTEQEENTMILYNIFEDLNEIGQRVAIERLEELAEIPKYQRTSDQEEE